jgi:pantetheine-phosphate adenylyltransferase
VCPGSFDPVTNGHLDVIARASGLFDEVLVAVLVNPAKQAMFTEHDRIDMLRESIESLGGLDNVSVEAFSGLLVDYCTSRGATVAVKGLRGMGDVDHEVQMAQMNLRLAGVDTVFLATDPAYSFVSSSLVKEVAAYGGDVGELVPDAASRRLMSRGRKQP